LVCLSEKYVGRKLGLKIISSEKKEKNEVELVIEVEPEELETAVNKAFIKNRNRIAVPGFRKGKAPRKIIEKMYGAEIFLSDALDDIMPDVLSYAMKETEFDIVGYPRITDLDVKDDKRSAEITLTAALRPEVTIGKYKGLSAPKPVIEIPESEIDASIETTRERNARMEKVERPAESGDIATIDFEGFVDGVAFEGGKGENHELTLGSGSFIPGFEEKVEGMETGETRDIDLVFPEDYKEDLAGKPVVFRVTLNELREKILPELDDEFVKDVSEFDTIDEYRADIKDKIVKTRQQDVDETFENILMDQIVESIEVEVPDEMVEEQLDLSMKNFSSRLSSYGMEPAKYMQMMGMTPEIFREKMRESSEKQVRIQLALGKIAELESVGVSDEEIETEYKDASERYGMEIGKFKETIERKDIINDLKLRKAAKIVVDSAIVEEFNEEDAKKKPESKKKGAR